LALVLSQVYFPDGKEPGPARAPGVSAEPGTPQPNAHAQILDPNVHLGSRHAARALDSGLDRAGGEGGADQEPRVPDGAVEGRKPLEPNASLAKPPQLTPFAESLTAAPGAEWIANPYLGRVHLSEGP